MENKENGAFKRVLSNIKKFFVDLYNEKGLDFGIYLLKNAVIALCFIVVLIILNGELTLGGIVEWVLALPVFTLLTAVTRIVIKGVNTIIPAGLLRLIVDIVAFVFVIVGFSFLFDKVPEVIGTIILVVFDIAFFVGLFFLLRKKNTHIDNND